MILRLFEQTIMTVIVLNSILIASYDYSDRDSLQRRNQVLDQIQLAFQILFSFECAMKIIAMGLFQRHNSYLRSGWNVIDLTVVVLGYLILF